MATKKAAPSKKQNKQSKQQPVAQTALPAQTTLDELRTELGQPDKSLQRRLFRRAQEADLAAEGMRVDSQKIIDDMPGFVGEGFAIFNQLTPTQRPHLKLPAGIFAVLVDESLTLRKLHSEHSTTLTRSDGSKAGREEISRKERRLGMDLRDLAYEGLRNALGNERSDALDEVIGTADTPEKLAQGLEGVAGFIDAIIKGGDADDIDSLDEFYVGATCASALRAQAQKVREAGAAAAAPDRQVSQRALDVQDGRVLHLVEMTLRAFRAARRVDASIPVPKLKRIARVFLSRSGRAKAQTTTAPEASQVNGAPVSTTAADA